MFDNLKRECHIAHLWAPIFGNEATVELKAGYKSWYIPFYYGRTRLVIDEEATFRTVYEKQ